MLKGILKRDVTKQFLKFCLVGLESTVLNYLFFLILLYFFAVNYTLSFAVGFIAGTLFGFVFNKLWSFQSERDSSKEIGLYILVYVFSLFLGILFLRFFVDSMHISPVVANLPVLILTTLINFFGTKILAFKNKKW
jgi:putative flippase GtrA